MKSMPFVGTVTPCGGESCDLSMGTCNSEGRQSSLPNRPVWVGNKGESSDGYRIYAAGRETHTAGFTGQPCGVPKKTTHPGTVCPVVAFPV